MKLYSITFETMGDTTRDDLRIKRYEIPKKTKNWKSFIYFLPRVYGHTLKFGMAIRWPYAPLLFFCDNRMAIRRNIHMAIRPLQKILKK